MIKRLLAIAAIGIVALAAPASAQVYAGDNSLTEVGGTLAARCFLGTVQFVDDAGNVIGTAEAVDGTANFRLPAGVSTTNVQARGTGCDGGTLVLDLVVSQPAPTTRAGALPRTGADSSIGLGQVGFALLTAGGVTLFLARRRQLAKVRA